VRFIYDAQNNFLQYSTLGIDLSIQFAKYLIMTHNFVSLFQTVHGSKFRIVHRLCFRVDTEISIALIGHRAHRENLFEFV